MSGASVDPEEVDEHNALGHLIGAYGRPHALRFGLGGLAMALSQIPGRVPALLVGIALDSLLLNNGAYSLPLVPQAWIPPETQGQVALTAVIFAAAFGGEAVLSWVGGRISGTATYRTLHDVRVDTFDALVGQEMGYFDDRQTGDLMSVLNNDVGNLKRFGDAFFRGLRFLTQVLVSFAFMAMLHWQLAVLLAVMPLVLAGISYWYAVRVEPRYDDVRSTIGSVNSRLEDSIEGIATVKAFGREDEERDAVERVSAQYKDDKWDVIRLRLVYNFSTWLLSALVFIAVFAVGALTIMGQVPPFVEPVSAGTLVTFLFYGKSFYLPIRQLMLQVLDAYENALASSKRIVAVLRRTNALADEHAWRDDAGSGAGDRDVGERVATARDNDRDAGPAELHVEQARLEYDDVAFAYEGVEERTIADVSFTAEPGDLVGIVGPTGAGKSTIVKLLFRFYDRDTGTIRIDDTDIESVTKRSLRDNLGYVSQDPFLFHGTVAENVAYANPDATREEVVDAAKRAGAHDFVTNLEDGYDSEVGDRGSRLSGGQRQRIAIARALLRDPSILVLDEATSHVDNETERQIQESVDDLGADQTTIAIAHRLSTVRDADTIVVLDDGRIREMGTHDELLDRDGLYADLWRVQVGETDAVSAEFFERASAEEVLE